MICSRKCKKRNFSRKFSLDGKRSGDQRSQFPMYSWQRCKLYIGFVQRCWFLMYFVQRCKMSMCFLQRCQLYMCLVQRCIFQMYFKQRWLCAMCFMQRSDLTCMSRRIGYESENHNANPIKICYLFVKWLLNIVVMYFRLVVSRER